MTILKVTWKDENGEYEGIRYFTKEDWQRRIDHINSFEFCDVDVYSEHGLCFSYMDEEEFLSCFTAEEVAKVGEQSGDFVDPDKIQPYVPEDEDFW